MSKYGHIIFCSDFDKIKNFVYVFRRQVDQTFEGVMDSRCPPMPMGQSRPYLVNFYPILIILIYNIHAFKKLVSTSRAPQSMVLSRLRCPFHISGIDPNYQYKQSSVHWNINIQFYCYTSECLASLGPLESLESRGRRVSSGECDHRSNAFRIKKLNLVCAMVNFTFICRTRNMRSWSPIINSY